jgi:hypothetical protein
MCPTTTASPPTTSHLKNMKRKRPTLKETQANQKLRLSDVPLDVQQAIMYLEYRKLRHKHPHV